jgi:hypothetical protein
MALSGMLTRPLQHLSIGLAGNGVSGTAVTFPSQVGSEWGVQGIGAGQASLALPSHTVATGHVVYIATQAAATTAPTANVPSQTAGTATMGSWTLIQSVTNSNGTVRTEWYTSPVTIGGSLTITITPSATSGITGSAWEFSNALGTADLTFSANNTGTAVAVGPSSTSAQAYELMLCAMAWRSGTATFAATGFNPAGTMTTGSLWQVTGGDSNGLQVFWQITGVPSTQSFSGNLSSSTFWGCNICTFEV